MIIHFAAKEKIGQENKHMNEQSNVYADCAECGMLLIKETLFQFCKASSIMTIIIDFRVLNALEFYSLCRLIIVIASLMFRITSELQSILINSIIMEMHIVWYHTGSIDFSDS